jgi:hypothetical protein
MSSRDLAGVQSRIGPGTFHAVMAATYGRGVMVVDVDPMRLG